MVLDEEPKVESVEDKGREEPRHELSFDGWTLRIPEDPPERPSESIIVSTIFVSAGKSK